MDGPARVREARKWPRSGAQWTRFLAGFALVFAAFNWLAEELNSVRGESGAIVAGTVLTLLWAANRWLLGESHKSAFAGLGLGVPIGRGIALALGLALALVVAAFALAEAGWHWYPNSLLLAAGIFLQAGVAEEALFRGYLYGKLRPGRSFRSAAYLAALPFAGVHLFLFLRFPWPIALASVALSVVLSFPLARAYELSGNTIWAPAILHAVIQAVPKLMVPALDESNFPLYWMGASAAISYAIFLIPRPWSSRRAAPVSTSA